MAARPLFFLPFDIYDGDVARAALRSPPYDPERLRCYGVVPVTQLLLCNIREVQTRCLSAAARVVRPWGPSCVGREGRDAFWHLLMGKKKLSGWNSCFRKESSLSFCPPPPNPHPHINSPTSYFSTRYRMLPPLPAWRRIPHMYRFLQLSYRLNVALIVERRRRGAGEAERRFNLCRWQRLLEKSTVAGPGRQSCIIPMNEMSWSVMPVRSL